MNLGKRLRQARTQRGYTQKQLAQTVGCSQQSINAIERGESTLPRKLPQIASRLNVTPEWLQYGINPKFYSSAAAISIVSGVHNIPIIKWTSVGDRLKSGENLTNHVGLIPISAKFNAKCFALQVNDDSMLNSTAEKMTFLSGATIIVDPDKQPHNGDYVISWSATSQAALFRQYLKKNNDYYLHALNRKYTAKTLATNDIIIGTLVHTSMDL